MTLGDLRTRYSMVHKEYNSKKYDLSVQLQETREKIKKQPENKDIYEEQAVVLELQYNAVDEQQKIYDDFIQEFMSQWSVKLTEISTRQNTEAQKDASLELGKILAVARRMSHGDIVPGSDEKKLMEYDSDLYQMAKNAQMMAQQKERKKYDSLWEDEEKKKPEDPIEAADAQESNLTAPDVIPVEEVIAGATNNEHK